MEKKYRIAWALKSDPHNPVFGEYNLNESTADAWVEEFNKKYPNISHWKELDNKTVLEPKPSK